MNGINRRENEGMLDYAERLISGKKEGLYDLDYVEMYELLFDKTISSTESRKRSYGIQDLLSNLEGESISTIEDQEIIDKIDDKKDELYKQQTKTRDKLRELRLHLRDEARIENINERFIECANIISKEKPIIITDYPISTTKHDRVGVLQLSDWHMGEFVDNFMNTYNQDVFDERMNTLTQDVITHCKTMDVDTIKVLNCGDLISGGLHIGTRVSDEEDSVYQTMYVAEALANVLLELAKNIPHVEFYSVVDNHSRVSRKKSDSIEKESFSRFLPWHLKTRLKDIANISIIDNMINGMVEYDIGLFNIFDEQALYTHGHNGRLKTMVEDLSLMTRVFPIAVFTAHLHRNFEEEVHSIDLIMNPSAIGTGEFAKSIRRSSQPRQKLTIFENKSGETTRLSTFIIHL